VDTELSKVGNRCIQRYHSLIVDRELGATWNEPTKVYDQGQKTVCVLAALMLGSAKEVFQERVQTLLQGWIDAIATILVEADMDAAIARERGEDDVIAIQGVLILSQRLKDPATFQQVVWQLPQTLYRDLPKQKTRAKKTG